MTVPWRARNPAAPFHQAHQQVYGYSDPKRAIEIVTIRVRAKLAVKQPKLVSNRARAAAKPVKRRIHCAGAWREVPVYSRDGLPSGKLRGPALVIDYGSTTLIPPGWTFSVDRSGTLKITA